MRLLRTDTLELVEFVGRVPPYVILSHTWGPDEVTFQDLSQLSKTALRKKAGYAKIAGCCARAIQDQYEYVWVDTCCIDKTSSAELSEAINSMYRWYAESDICYAYMADVAADETSHQLFSDTSSVSSLRRDVGSPPPKAAFRTIPSILREYDKLPRTFEHSRWFTRGWTLQELIAPPLVEFYDHDWHEIGTKFSLRNIIAKVTGIPILVLEGADPSTCHVAERMSWAANRQTTRIEDAAYCLLGIFKVHMPLIYGEGHRAFYRLQKEIMKTTEDYTMLAWGLSKYLSNKHHWKGVKGDPRRPLADGPIDFEEHNRNLWTYVRLIPDSNVNYGTSNPSSAALMDDTPPLITSRGLRVTLLLRPARKASHQPQGGRNSTTPANAGEYHAYINCKTSRTSSINDPLLPVCLVIRPELKHSCSSSSNVYTGSDDPDSAFVLLDNPADLAQFSRQTIYLSTASLDDALGNLNHRISSLSKNLYILDKPPALRPGDSTKATWKITSCHSHAVGSGPGHGHYEVPRKFTSASLFQPFELPPYSVRLFAFELPAPQTSDQSDNAFGIVIGNGWCDVISLNDVEFQAKWGVLVRNGKWNEVNALRYIQFACGVYHHPGQGASATAIPHSNHATGANGQGLEDDHLNLSSRRPKDRVVKKVGFGGLEVAVKLKKVRRVDINSESAIRIQWSAVTI
ncbi:Putative Protein similar to Vegetative incompatibility protein HET-E-1 of Podospora anserina [Podospora comata]|uniref:Heterokaryon incompatibility domain-containing protein n=1 Tax=Podospora comata TaxID=48703 RepID=A0ABY6SFG9_PODCO|nr:Putative Protein similar to Vegetative incompatibility protein HET-E-1 of Podospora anserina [Podospora comata]